MAVKLLLALLQAVPAIIQSVEKYRGQKQKDERDAKIEADPLGEFEHKFGQLQSDTKSDSGHSGSENLHNPETERNKNDSPNSR